MMVMLKTTITSTMTMKSGGGRTTAFVNYSDSLTVGHSNNSQGTDASE